MSRLTDELRGLRLALGRLRGLPPESLEILRTESNPWAAYRTARARASIPPAPVPTPKAHIPRRSPTNRRTPTNYAAVVVGLLVASLCLIDPINSLSPWMTEAAVTLATLAALAVIEARIEGRSARLGQ